MSKAEEKPATRAAMKRAGLTYAPLAEEPLPPCFGANQASFLLLWDTRPR